MTGGLLSDQSEIIETLKDLPQMASKEDMKRILNYQKFRTGYELGILSHEEFIKLAAPCIYPKPESDEPNCMICGTEIEVYFVPSYRGWWARCPKCGNDWRET